jgi:hypothetical protein
VQTDERGTSAHPEELPVAIEPLGVVSDSLPAHFITHVSYGAFELIYSEMFGMPMDNLELELSNSGLDMLAVSRSLSSRRTLALA